MKCYANNHVSLLHLNIKSLQNRMDGLSIFLSSLNVMFYVIEISETWLHDSSCGVNFNSYKNLSTRSGEGIECI